MRVGWIGLGMMGLGMASCAARAGFDVVGHTRGRPAHAALVAAGGRLVRSYEALLDGVDVVCVNVFDDAQLRTVLYDDGLLARLPAGACLVVHTTGDPGLSREAQARAPAGVAVVDAAFSGTPAQAADGTLTIMVGGEAGAVGRLACLFESYAALVRHVGPVGAGMQLKLLNNLLFAAQVRLAESTYAIAAREGFAVEVVRDILAACSGASRALAIIGAEGRVAENVERMTYYTDKDVATARAIAAAAGLDLGLLGAVAGGAA